MKKEKEFHGSWIDVLAAVLVIYKSLIIPFVLLIAALLFTIILFRIVFL
jgi:hypothetical protein